MKYIKISEIIWFILLLLSLLSLVLGKIDTTITMSILLVSTGIKVLLVSEYFMGLNQVSLLYRGIPIIWTVVVLGLIGIAYYF